MLLRRLYQIIGWLCLTFGFYSVISGVIRAITFHGENANPVASIILGAFLGLLSGVTGFIILKLATGPAEAGITVLGVDNKANDEKEKSLLRKPQKVITKA